MSDSPAQTQVGSVDGRCWHDTLTIRQVVEEYSIPENTLRWWRKSGAALTVFPSVSLSVGSSAFGATTSRRGSRHSTSARRLASAREART